jgi:hypothetical protein
MSDTTRTREILTSELRLTSEGFTRSLGGLSTEAWRFRPGADRWSIAETAEHVAVVESAVLRSLTTRLAGSPLPEAERAGQRARDAQIARVMFDRSTRRPAPDIVLPTGRFADPAQAVQLFSSARSSIIAWLATTELDLRGLALPHPALGLLDGMQWVLFAAAHSERHTRQILEVKQLPGYPGT